MRIARELLEGKKDPELLQAMEKDLEEMVALINRTLELARMMQTETSQSEAIDLKAFLKELQASYGRQGKDFRLRLDTAPRLNIDRLILNRILHNLLDNAFHYAGKGEIELLLHQSSENISICIRDRGKGIPAEEIGKVMQPFHRLDLSRNLGSGRSGLGLAIVAQLAQLQGWEIRLTNRPSGGLSACLKIPASTIC